MKAFSLLAPSKIVFGPGKLAELPSLVSELVPGGQCSGELLLLSDKGVAGTGLPARAERALTEAGRRVRLVDTVPPEPSDRELDAIAAALGGTELGAIVAIGGGSVMDAAKILSVLAATGKRTAELAEKGVERRGSPTIMVPTTAGTGSESTPNAIVLFPEKSLKVGIVSQHFMPDGILLDPELLVALPPKLTASTGLDALCHLLECFLGKKANPMSDMMAREGLRLIAPSLPAAYRNGADLEARSATMLAAYYGGACIAASGTNAVHALSYPLGGGYRIPHGVANAALLAPVMRFQKDRIASRLAEAARAMGRPALGSAEAEAEALVEWLDALVAELGIPRSLGTLGVPESALGELADAAFGVRRLLDNNPVELSREDILAIYRSVK